MTTSDIENRILGSLDNLPTLPGVAMSLMDLTLAEDSSIQKIAELIETDPSIAARVLRVANSPIYGRPKRVSSIRRAIVVLGLNPLRELVLAVAVVQSLKVAGKSNKNEYLFPNPDFWRHSLAVGWTAKAICEEVRYPDPDKGFLAGLLHDVGIVALNLQLGARYSKPYKEFVVGGKAPLSSFEKDTFGIDHAGAGKILLSRWHFPDTLAKAIGDHHSADAGPDLDAESARLGRILALADNFASHQGFTMDRMLDPPQLKDSLVQQVGLPPRDLGRLGHGLVKTVSKIASILEVELPDVHEYLERLQKANSALSQRALELESEVKRLALLNEVALMFCSILDTKEAVQVAAESLDRVLPLRILTLTLFKKTPPSMNLCLIQGISRKDLQKAIRHSVHGAGKISDHPINPTQVQLDIANRDLVKDTEDGTNELVFMDQPVEIRGERVGLFSMGFSIDDQFTDRDENLFRTVARLMGMSLELAHLHGVLQ